MGFVERGRFFTQTRDYSSAQLPVTEPVLSLASENLIILNILVIVILIEIVIMRLYVTAACPYPALRLDKLYAALIRCLVLWTVTKQFLLSCFKGLYLLA